jgi:hypothetical protein
MAAQKTKMNNKDVVDFINQLEDESRKADCFRLIDILSELTGEAPKMWGTSIVGFGTYRYKYASGHEGEWALLGFSPRKRETSLYIYSQGSGSQKLLPLLGKYKMGKACIYIKKLSDIDEEILRQIAQHSIDYISKTYTRIQ